ncbi:MAG: outer membrane lipoprotein chaperone LolA [Burkholderiaceae bacterium]
MSIDRIAGLVRRGKALALAVALALGSAPAWAAGAIDSLERFLSDTSGASGNFTQETVGGSSARVERSQGSFAFERPGRFRWEVTRPYEQLMVADGEQVWFYDRDLEQVTVRPMTEAMGATPAAILFGSGGLDADFVLADAGEQDGLQWLLATPRSGEAGFERIRIGFGDSLPRAMEVLDAFGRTVRFRFDSIDTSPDFTPGTFRFEVPAGTDVIRQ